jgi:hypothetical protein
VLRVSAAPTGLIEVDYLRPWSVTEGVIEEAINIGQAKTAAQKQDEQQKRPKTTPATNHESS